MRELTANQKEWCKQWEVKSEYDPMWLEEYKSGEIEFTEVVSRNNRWLEDHLGDIYLRASRVANDIFPDCECYE